METETVPTVQKEAGTATVIRSLLKEPDTKRKNFSIRLLMMNSNAVKARPVTNGMVNGAGSLHSYEYLINEAQSLVARLKQVKPFSMTMPMVKGASVSSEALQAITAMLEKSKLRLYDSLNEFIRNAKNAREKNSGNACTLQSAFTIQKLRYNSILDQLDIFADVLSQRAEHEVGIWLSGLDVLAEDGLQAGKKFFEIPALMVFLERGHGAAIRRARTRLPGGDENPVAVIQIPRERMVGSGIASSLIHEVGHQAIESMEITKSLRAELAKHISLQKKNIDAWKHYERWISEILADCWALGQMGVTATLGVMGVVTLPKYFQFRLDLEDPHPAPYVRVKLSCAFGNELFPHPQWKRLWELWEHFYPPDDIQEEKKRLLKELDEEEDAFVRLVLNHRPDALKGKIFKQLFPTNDRQPEQLQRLYKLWKQRNTLIERAPPTLVFAVMGQAKHDRSINAEEENSLLTQQLRNWAYHRK